MALLLLLLDDGRRSRMLQLRRRRRLRVVGRLFDMVLNQHMLYSSINQMVCQTRTTKDVLSKSEATSSVTAPFDSFRV